MGELSESSELRTAAIGDRQTGEQVIAQIRLNDAPQAQIDLCRVLDGLHAAPPDGETYFSLLERIRLPIAAVAEELARRYLNKPLPLAEQDERIFQRTVSLWLKTARAYAHCAENDSPQNDASHPRRVALILHRCIHHTGQAIAEHQRARREYPWGLWHDLHGYYASAEEWGVASLEIADLKAAGNTDCTTAYLACILGEMAGCYGLSIRQQTLVRRWAITWAPLVSLQRVEVDPSLPYVVDLMQDAALRPTSTEHLRRLDTSRLTQRIADTREQLRQKIPPAQLALGDDCSASQCRRLLAHLSHPWSQARAPRAFKRHDCSAGARVCTGFDEIHYFISGHEFEQPDNVRVYSRREFEALFTFRHQDDPRQPLHIHQQQLAYSVDHWTVANTSANGFRLLRSSGGRKLAHGQLIALCPPDGERFLLAQTTWLMQDRNAGLVVGVRTLPGIPAAIAARQVDVAGKAEGKYQRAFLLPAVPAVGAEQSLVIPQGWFRYAKVIELDTDGSWRIELRHVLDDGPDFERVSFARC